MKNQLILLHAMRCFFPVLTSAILLFILASYFYTRLYQSLNLTVRLGLITLVFLLLNILVWRVVSALYTSLLQQQAFELKKNELKNVVLLAEQLAEHEEIINKIHHDLKNHLGVVYSMLSDGQQEEALKYTEKLRGSLKSGAESC